MIVTKIPHKLRIAINAKLAHSNTYALSQPFAILPHQKDESISGVVDNSPTDIHKPDPQMPLLLTEKSTMKNTSDVTRLQLARDRLQNPVCEASGDIILLQTSDFQPQRDTRSRGAASENFDASCAKKRHYSDSDESTFMPDTKTHLDKYGWKYAAAIVLATSLFTYDLMKSNRGIFSQYTTQTTYIQSAPLSQVDVTQREGALGKSPVEQSVIPNSSTKSIESALVVDQNTIRSEHKQTGTVDLGSSPQSRTYSQSELIAISHNNILRSKVAEYLEGDSQMISFLKETYQTSPELAMRYVHKTIKPVIIEETKMRYNQTIPNLANQLQLTQLTPSDLEEILQ